MAASFDKLGVDHVVVGVRSVTPRFVAMQLLKKAVMGLQTRTLIARSKSSRLLRM